MYSRLCGEETYLQSLHLSDDFITLVVAALCHKHIHFCKLCRPLCNVTQDLHITSQMLMCRPLCNSFIGITSYHYYIIMTSHHYYILMTSHIITSPLHHIYISVISSLTPEIVCYEEHGTLPDDAAHRVCVLNVAEEQLMFVEHPRGRMSHFVRPHKPRTMEPGIITVCG